MNQRDEYDNPAANDGPVAVHVPIADVAPPIVHEDLGDHGRRICALEAQVIELQRIVRDQAAKIVELERLQNQFD